MTGPTRRDLFKIAGLALAPAALTACAGDGGTVGPGTLTSAARLPEPYTLPLPIPVPARPLRSGPDGDHYDMTIKESTAEILPGYSTRIWGYDGTFPGTYLEARSGTPLIVRQTNLLPVPVATHLHGGIAPPSQDGFPTDLLYPRGLAHLATGHAGHGAHGGHAVMHDPHAQVSIHHRTYAFPMRQRAATLWYHDHRMDFTGAQVWKGLAGLCVVRDDEDDALPLPRGDRDIPLLMCDRAFDADGQLAYPAIDPTLLGAPGMAESIMGGAQGDVILVNGAPWPYLEVDAARYRLRLVNGSNARRYELRLDGPADSEFTQIGGDGGLLPAPVRHATLRISPAERFDVVVDFSRYPAGSTATLVNLASTGGAGQVMRFHITRRATDDSAIPDRLSDIPELTPGGAHRQLVFSRNGSQWQINGKPFNPAVPHLRPAFGTTEHWTVLSVERHPFHLHGAFFQVLGRDSAGPGPYDAGWKDTVELAPGAEIHLAVRFDAYRGRYLAHCHNLEHEDMAMMATLQVG
ncbi:spore coat protein A [Planobispora rosea]|uniref:Multicopper oxidase CueO n=1 Tax=Planobispora rosea TaxID=35762 RepID=A0A8J3WAY0_PLARO|nr:multicopper oxidase domain-containing protein [Planobispora rosea]GGS46987.1 spore coat protein A [Planobispora rosea]GIH82277.1 spore coat protein A [Planobispora rosea]